MNQTYWKTSCITTLMVAGLAALSLAQEAPIAARAGHSGRGAYGFVSTLEKKVGLTPEQRDAVHGLLADQRQKSQALREETDQKIRAILNPEQQKKFDEVLAEQKTKKYRKNAGA